MFGKKIIVSIAIFIFTALILVCSVVAAAGLMNIFHKDILIKVLDSPSIEVKTINEPTEIKSGDAVELVYRISNKRDTWSSIHWKIALPENAKIQIVFTKIGYVGDTAYIDHKIKEGNEMVPPGSFMDITIIVLTPTMIPPSDLSISIDIEDRGGIWMDPETDKMLRGYPYPEQIL